MGLATPDEAADWAVGELDEDRDGRALRILAGLAKPASWWEAEPLLEKALIEVGCGLRASRDLCVEYARDIARAFLSGTLPASDAAREVGRIYYAIGYPSALCDWICFDCDIPRWNPDLSLDGRVTVLARELLGLP